MPITKIYKNCTGCGCKLVMPSQDPECRRCKVMKLDNANKQKITLTSFT